MNEISHMVKFSLVKVGVQIIKKTTQHKYIIIMFKLGRTKYLCDVEKYIYAISKMFQRHNIGIV